MENKTLLNILSPIGGIEYKKNYIRVGDYLGSICNNKISSKSKSRMA